MYLFSLYFICVSEKYFASFLFFLQGYLKTFFVFENKYILEEKPDTSTQRANTKKHLQSLFLAFWKRFQIPKEITAGFFEAP